jgi:hypothetical protein
MLTETQGFVSSIVYNQVRPPKLWWSRDMCKVSVDGETLELDTFRSGIQRMIEDAWELYYSVSGGKRFADLPFENVKDQLSNDTHGYSFLSGGPFGVTPNGLLHHLIRTQHLASIDGEGHLSWDTLALRRFFGACDRLNELLSILTYILPTPSIRVSEFIDHKLRNASRNRNLHVLTGEMVLLARYHKMTNGTGLDVCTPAFYPKSLRELTFEILAGGLRECETVLAPILFGGDSEATKLYHTSVPVSAS